MNDLYQILLAGAILGVLLAGIIVLKYHNPQQAKFWLGLLVLAIALVGIR